MRKSPQIDALFPKTRQIVLGAVVMNPAREWYLSDLAKNLGVTVSSLQRELARLVAAGILVRRVDGNRVYYRADTDCPLLKDLQGLLAKTVGLADVLRQALEPHAESILLALIYGSIARGEERSASDIDLLIVGGIGLADIATTLRDTESRLLRPINPTLYSPEEFARKLKTGDHLLTGIVRGEVIFVIGDRRELEGLARSKPHSQPRHKQTGA